MDRLIALLQLRLTLETRGLLGARSRIASLVLVAPLLALFSLAASLAGFTATGVLGRSHAELLLPALSGLAGLLGLSWVLSPLLAGVATTESHDLTRLAHYPVPLRTLVVASLVAGLGQPLVLAQLPPLAAVALALGGAGLRGLGAFAALALAFAFTLACGQAVAFALHALSRQRRWHDRALVAGILLSLVLSVTPILLLSASGGFARNFLLSLLANDAFVLLPFSWGVRAAVLAGRGDALPALAWAAAALLAVGAALGVSVALAERIYRGELDLGAAGGRRGRRATMRLPGAVGALVEKDLRMAWRDPRLKALLFSGVIGPLLILLVVFQGVSRVSPGLLLSLGSVTGVGIVGANALAVERQGLALLLGFPLARTQVLAAKNLVAMVLRLPALAVVAFATLLVARPLFVPLVLSIALLTELVACGIDNYLSVILPVPVAAAGRDPNAPGAGSRGLGMMLLVLAAAVLSLVVSAPFAFLVWLPYLLGAPWLWLLAVPLALAGAAAVYFMLLSGAARLVAAREPELVARAAGDE